MDMGNAVIKWKLGEVLERERLTVYRLHQELSEDVSRNTLYRLSNAQPERIELSITANILGALERLTGKHVALTDLLEYTPEPSTSEKAPPAPLALTGMIDDPDSPGDISARHDDYLGEQLDEKHRAEVTH